MRFSWSSHRPSTHILCVRSKFISDWLPIFVCVCKNQLVQPPFDSDDLTECSFFRVYSFSLYLSFSYPSPTELHWHMQIQEHKQHYRSRRYLYSYILKRQHYFFYPLTKYWTYLNSLSSVFVSYSRWLRRFIFFYLCFAQLIQCAGLLWYNLNTCSDMISLSCRLAAVDFSANQDRLKEIQFSLVRSVFGATLKKPILRIELQLFSNWFFFLQFKLFSNHFFF